MSTKPTKAQQWPKRAEAVRRDTKDKADDGARRAAAARRAVEALKHETALVHIGYMRELFLEIGRDMEQVKYGEPDALATALRLLAGALDGKDVHEDARALLARYEEFVP